MSELDKALERYRLALAKELEALQALEAARAERKRLQDEVFDGEEGTKR